MKKILIYLFIFILTLTAFAEDMTYQKWLQLFEIEATVEYNKEELSLTIVDTTIEKSIDIQFQLSYILTALDFYFQDKQLKYEDIPQVIKTLYYRVEKFELVINGEWLFEYYSAKRRDQYKLLSQLLFPEFKQQQKLK